MASEGSESTFELSRPETRIDMFVSHSWMGVGWLKIVAVAYHVNVRRAVLLFLLAFGLTLAPDLAGFEFPIPSLNDEAKFAKGASVLPGPRLQWVCLLPCVTFVLALLYGQELRFGVSLFLDKCCIHQTDERKKLAGIKQLGAFLNVSDSLVVLWQPEYLTRLWCVYELAAFVHIEGGSCRHVVFCPPRRAAFVVCTFLFHTVATSLVQLMFPLTLWHSWHVERVAEFIPEAVQPLYHSAWLFLAMLGLYGPVSPFLWSFCKRHMRDREKLLQQLSSFSFSDAQCREESDRAYVQEQVERWFGSITLFEKYVRETLVQHVETHLKAQGPLTYSMLLVGTLPHVCVLHVIVTMWVDGVEGVVPFFFSILNLILFADAIAIGILLRLAGTSFGECDDKGASIGRRVSGPMAVTLIFAVATSTMGVTLTPGCSIEIAVAMTALQCLVTMILYMPRRWREVSKLAEAADCAS
jgi:hypothetical protein